MLTIISISGMVTVYSRQISLSKGPSTGTNAACGLIRSSAESETNPVLGGIIS